MSQKVLKILMLEDGKDDVGLIERILKKANVLFETRVVDQEEDFRKEINEFHPDLILSDHSLPQFNSLEALKICRNLGLKTPFILVTGTVSDEFATKCLNAGAADYVLKSNLEKLPAAISSALEARG